MIDVRLRMYIVGRILRNVRMLDYQYLWRIYNALRCLLSRHHAILTSQPFFAQIEPTTACNLHCRHCERTALEDTRAFLSYEQFVHILDSLPGLLLVNLQGAGEPTLHKDLFRMASEARRRQIYVFTVTNLNVPERTIHRLAESDFNEINFSMESADPERYEWFRGGGSLALLESNLRLLSDLKNRNGRDFSVGLWTTITKETLGSIEEIFQFAEQTNAVERIQAQFLQDKDNYVAHYDDELQAQRIRDWKGHADKVRNLLQFYSKRYGLRSSLIAGRCRWPWGGLFINAKGLLAPCCNIKDYRNPFWGHIASGSLDKAWHSQEWASLREGLLSGVPHRACSGCPFARLN